jgi:hypothetical protein
MAIRDLAAQQAFLDNVYGSSAGSHSPSTWELALFAGDPVTDDTAVEADSTSCPGYARVTFAQSVWAATDSEGVKRLTSPRTLPSPTDEWALTLTHWALFSGSDHVTMWNADALLVPLDVTAAGAGPSVDPVVFLGDPFIAP